MWFVFWVFLHDLLANAVAAGILAAPKAQYREKLVAIASRRECVYKRAGELSVTFHERGGTTECVTDFSTKKNRNGAKSVPTCNNDIILLPHRFLLDFKRFSSFYPYQFQRQNKSLLQDLFYHKTILFTRPFSKFLVKILPLHFRQFDLIGYVAYEPDNHFLL